jgi:diacylglycerol kinase family enzyme
MPNYLLIANPVSGRGKGRRRAEALRSALSDASSVEVVETTHRGAATELAAAQASEVDRVIAVGGDGTLNEVVCGLMQTGLEAQDLPELGFLPSGTANAAVRAFGLASDPTVVGQALARASSRPVDVGVVSHAGGERAFLLWFGAGYDAVVIRALNETRTGLMGVSGLLGNTPNVVSALARYVGPPIDAEVEASPFGYWSGVVVANVKDIAFGGVLVEEADPFDGHFDVVGIPRARVPGLLRLIARTLTSSLSKARGVRHRTATRVTLRSEGEVPFHLDGEPVGTLPAVATLRRGAVRFLET